MPWPVATAILQLVLSRTTITSSHRRARIGGISFSPTGLLFLAGVSLSLSVQQERHLPTQNQNSHYCAAAKRFGKRTLLIWNQFHFCLPKTINERLFKRLMWIAQMQIKWSCNVSLCQECLCLIVVCNCIEYRQGPRIWPTTFVGPGAPTWVQMDEGCNSPKHNKNADNWEKGDFRLIKLTTCVIIKGFRLLRYSCSFNFESLRCHL